MNIGRDKEPAKPETIIPPAKSEPAKPSRKSEAKATPIKSEDLLQMPANGWPATEPAPEQGTDEKARRGTDEKAEKAPDGKESCQERGFHVDALADTDKDSRGLTGKRPYACTQCGAQFPADEKPLLDVLWTIRLWNRQGEIDNAAAQSLIDSWTGLYEQVHEAKQAVADKKKAEAEKQRAEAEKEKEQPLFA